MEYLKTGDLIIMYIEKPVQFMFDRTPIKTPVLISRAEWETQGEEDKED